MTTQIAVRLPDDVVGYVDTLVKEGVGSRAAVVTRALRRYQQQQQAERDAQILEETGDYEDFATLPGYASVED
ncbi:MULTISPECIES: ribbon-helix-helix domain-containing protein [Citricoccus]|uniref:Ribbon-helix-helix domain-containing protein n=1 Tax=Citricoccus parietis TaxID=592307 RepID=A0ABV6F887_9MICC|nr:ribbon-helix-helix domain-containing protein [Citricoccus sp. K5]VXC21501.1 conserved hypothetical protein [Citricoccus sp. K5]